MGRARDSRPRAVSHTEKMSTTTLHPPILLKSGRLIVHHLYGNGAQRAVPATGRAEMTEDEWDDYCAKLVASQRRQGANQIIRSK